jgi:hypothetical protein
MEQNNGLLPFLHAATAHCWFTLLDTDSYKILKSATTYRMFAQMCQKTGSHLKIPGVWCVSRSKVHTKEAQTLETIEKKISRHCNL